jgi:DNA-binding Lrp family transcriptional regulator
MSKNIKSFAAFLEQTERKAEKATLPHAESAPDTEIASGADSASGAIIVSHVNSAPHAEITPHEDSASDVKARPEPVRKVRDAETVSRAEIAPVRGHLRVPNEVIYNVLPTLKPSEAIVLLRLYALSHGFQKSTCTVSLDKLASGCNLSRTQTRVCVRNLERKKLIKGLGMDNTNSQKELRGLHFEVKLPSATRAETAPHPKSAPHAEAAPNKEKTIKETTQTQDEPVVGARVGSRFTIEECRRYAQHLQATGQGINNPGGYATTIHRTGEADALIESFLRPQAPSPSSNLDTSQCPDCHGTGFYYPEGVGGGVAKCRHERLGKEGEQEITPAR